MSDARHRSPIGHHMVMRLWDNRVIAKTDDERRTVARSVLTVARTHKLLAFGLIDTHLHAENAEDWTRCGRLGQKIGASLKQSLQLDVGFTPVYRKPIQDQGHLYHTFYYDLGQHDHHGVTTDPLHEASNLPDLLGLRVLGSYTKANQQELAPRVQPAKLYQILQVEGLREDADVPYDGLVEAAAAAACLPDLGARSHDVVCTKAAAIHAAAQRYDDDRLALMLGLKRRRIGELRQRAHVDQELVRAIRLQLVLRHIKRSEGGVR